MLTPQKYAVARCYLGVLGIITSDNLETVNYSNGQNGKAWTGFSLEDTTTYFNNTERKVSKGDLWCSKQPEILYYLTAEEVEFDGEFSIEKTLESMTLNLENYI